MAYTIDDAQIRLAYRLGETAVPSSSVERARRFSWLVDGIRDISRKKPMWFMRKTWAYSSVANMGRYKLDNDFRRETDVYVDGIKHEKLKRYELDARRLGVNNEVFNDGVNVITYTKFGNYLYIIENDEIELIPAPSTTPQLKSVNSIVYDGGMICTATVNGHSYKAGDYITIAGSDQQQYNGTFNIFDVNENSFKYMVSSEPTVSPATGSITAIVRNIVINGYRKLQLPTSGSDSIVIPDDYIDAIVAFAEGRFWASAHMRAKASDAFLEYETIVNDMLREDFRRTFKTGVIV